MFHAMSEIVENTAPKQRVIGRPFPKGVSGNPAGKPKGSRHKVAEAFLADLAECWQRRGAAALDACAIEEPSQFCRIVANLLPRQAELNVDVSVLHDCSNVLEAFRVASDLLGVDPRAGIRRLQRIAPQIEHER